VLAGSRPLRNSLVRPVGIAAGRSRPRAACGASVRPLTPVLEHARFPLQAAPLLGAPQGTPFSFDPASCLVFEASFRFEVVGQIESEAVAAEHAPLYGLAVIT